MNIVFGKKQSMKQVYLSDGTRIPVTKIGFDSMVVLDHKTQDKDGYVAVRIGVGSIKPRKITKSKSGLTAKIKKDYYPSYIKEVKFDNADELPEVGVEINSSEILQPGDVVKVTGRSKGKGFAGGVKRHNFRGGPRTHGQSDRERAPGSIGQSTTPGRVYKGKRMAGHMGFENVSVSNLTIVALEEDGVLIKGLVPGSVNTDIQILKTGHIDNFPSLFGVEVKTEESEETSVEEPEKAEEVKTETVEPEVKAEETAETEEKVEEKTEVVQEETEEKKEVEDAKS